MMGRRRLRPALAVGVIAACIATVSSSGRAAAGQVALVIGNGTYTSLTALSACPLSAHSVSAALHRIGFDVIEAEDTSGGDFQAAIGEFGRKLGEASGSAAVVYVCGYAAGYDGRAFLLPVTAAMARPSDALTQGVLAKSLIGVTARGEPGAALVVLDLVPTPGPPGQLGLETLAKAELPPRLGLLAATEAGGLPAAGATRLANALASDLAAPGVATGPLLNQLVEQLGSVKNLTLAVQRAPDVSESLTGMKPPRQSAERVRPTPSVAPPPAPPPPAQTPQAPQAPAAPAAATGQWPSEDQMTDTQRRDVQIALAKLGYYDERIDGVFGPNTRAAIRRYQHEIHADMTGVLTPEQATRLVADAR